MAKTVKKRTGFGNSLYISDGDICDVNKCKPGICLKAGNKNICQCQKGYLATKTRPPQCKGTFMYLYVYIHNRNLIGS